MIRYSSFCLSLTAVSLLAAQQPAQPLPPEQIQQQIRAAGHDPIAIHHRLIQPPEDPLPQPAPPVAQLADRPSAAPPPKITSLPPVPWPGHVRPLPATGTALTENVDGFPENRLLVQAGNTQFTFGLLPGVVVSANRGSTSLLLHSALEPANRIEFYLLPMGSFLPEISASSIGGYAHWLIRQKTPGLELDRSQVLVPPYSFLIMDRPWGRLHYHTTEPAEETIEYFFHLPPYQAVLRLAGSAAWVKGRAPQVEQALSSLRQLP